MTEVPVYCCAGNSPCRKVDISLAYLRQVNVFDRPQQQYILLLLWVA